MLLLKIIDAMLLAGFFVALYWVWKHITEVRNKVIQNDGMPRDASRGLVYGLIAFLLVGFVMVHVYWLT